MCRADQAGQSRLLVNVDGGHQIKPQQSQIGQIVSSEVCAAQMSVDASQTAKAITRDAHALKIGQLNASRIADNHIFDVTLTIDQRPNLAIGLMRKFAKLSSKFRRQNLTRRDASLIQLFDPPQLIWLETVCVAVKISHPVDWRELYHALSLRIVTSQVVCVPI